MLMPSEIIARNAQWLAENGNANWLSWIESQYAKEMKEHAETQNSNPYQDVQRSRV
jgi:hypothetical protein